MDMFTQNAMTVENKVEEDEMDNVKMLENRLIRKSMAILGKKKISKTEEKIIADTVRLIEIRHSMNYCK